MIIRKLTDPIFIHFAKIYIHFYKEKKDHWYIFPSLILAAIITLNIEILSFYVIDLNKYYYAGLAIFSAIFFLLLYRNIEYEYVKNYKMSNKTRVIISMLILVDMVIIFTCLNIIRNREFMW